MFGLFGREKKAKEKHEQELKDRLANRLANYETANNTGLSKFANADFDELSKPITMIEFSNDAWTEWAKENPSEIGVFSKRFEIKA
ncbi:MAG: hypothetical protein ACI8P9_002907 [Parasphingorhabdus sp.]|jgi:hypothetical protein